MKRLLFLILSFLLSINLYSETMNLDKFQMIAKKSNYKIKSMEFDILKNEAMESASKANFYPRLGVEGGWMKDSSNGQKDSETLYEVWGEYNLFNGFKDKSKLLINRLETKSARSKKREKEFQLELKVEHLYFDFLFVKKKNEIIQEAINRNQNHLKLIKKRLNSGLVPKTDLLEFQLLESKLRSQKKFLTLVLEEKHHHFSDHIKPDGTLEVDLKGELPHLRLNQKLDEVLSHYHNSNEDLKRLQLKKDMIRRESQIISSSWMPKVDLKARYGHLPEQQTGFDSSESTTSIAIMARWELFSGNSTKHQYEASKFSRRSKEMELLQTKSHDLIVLKAHYKKLINLQTRIELEEESEIIARELYKRTLIEYQRGIKDSGALSSVSEELLQIENQIYFFKHEFIETKLEVEKLIGTRLKTLTIKH